MGEGVGGVEGEGYGVPESTLLVGVDMVDEMGEGEDTPVMVTTEGVAVAVKERVGGIEGVAAGVTERGAEALTLSVALEVTEEVPPSATV